MPNATAEEQLHSPGPRVIRPRREETEAEEARLSRELRVSHLAARMNGQAEDRLHS